MKKLTLLLLVVFLFVASPVMGEEQFKPVSTHDLIGACLDAVYPDDTLTTKTFCLAFIQGAVSAHMLLTSSYNYPLKFCLPESIGVQKMVGIFLKYTREQPYFFEKPAILTLYYALNDAYPCSEPSK